jgi:hypothetical protein
MIRIVCPMDGKAFNNFVLSTALFLIFVAQVIKLYAAAPGVSPSSFSLYGESFQAPQALVLLN